MAPFTGIEFSGSALGFTQAAVAVAVIVCAVVPALGSALEALTKRKTSMRLIIGELVVALILLSASGRVLHDSVHARIVGTGDGRVLAVRASATMEVVE